ncbi:MAG: DUF5107 domain-containing protein [Phycisphaerae bacterium]
MNVKEAKLQLPAAPLDCTGPVKAWAQEVMMRTYEPAVPDKNPLFLEKRVYQGSSGRVYPLPVIDSISTIPHDRLWQAVHLENEFIRLMVLPEIGGRIHIGLDKTNGYDFFYRQNVIKPALVGLAGPWASGGVEFNWPQHHRPATFMPVNWTIEEHPDGGRTIWLSDHDPMNRLKGMHGVCLRPGLARVELKVRLFNRTLLPQSFLWWANVAVHVHEHYQSFFPPDVHIVADHARRANSEFPLCRDHYYGVDYGRRAKHGIPPDQLPTHFIPPGNYPPNDLSWYANIPVPTSYMAIGSRHDFSGGYDHARQAGLIHVANHHIAPGKKQWTWGNHDFGYAWDRHLTDSDGPYIELMGGVFTDNQPDFSFLAPGETRAFTQYWYPIREIGPAIAANESLAVSLAAAGQSLHVGVAVIQAYDHLAVTIKHAGKILGEHGAKADPSRPILFSIALKRRIDSQQIEAIVRNQNGNVLLHHLPEVQTQTRVKSSAQAPATEPPLPPDVASNDELYIIGLHLDQYRHATHYPEIYWREALRRDPGDSRCLNAMGLWHLKRGEFTLACDHFQRAINRLTSRNANPYDGECFYNLGVAWRFRSNDAPAYDAFYKATWNQAWQAAAFLELARIDCHCGRWEAALQHLDKSLLVNGENLSAANLKVIVLQKLQLHAQAESLLQGISHIDKLDVGSRFLRGEIADVPTQERLDLSLDLARAGLWDTARAVLPESQDTLAPGTAPLVDYYRGYFWHNSGQTAKAKESFSNAARANPDWCFPSRLEEILILETAIAENPDDGLAHYYLGNLLYDRKRHGEAIKQWEKAARLKPDYSVIWRNLGIGYFNVLKQPAKARRAYQRARQCNSADPRLLYEQDQLAKRMGVKIHARLSALEASRDMERKAFSSREDGVQDKITKVRRPAGWAERDDLAIEYCALLNLARRHEEALAVLTSRHFQPWEGGEGRVLEQFVRANCGLGRDLLRKGKAADALRYFQSALKPPETLGEARHPLANCSDIYFYLGQTYAALGQKAQARQWWRRAASSRGDFQQMAVTQYSEMTLYTILALRELGKMQAAGKLIRAVTAYARELECAPAKIDYFATSLPTLLLFEADMPAQQKNSAQYLQAQMQFALGRKGACAKLLARIVKSDPSNAPASELLAEIMQDCPAAGKRKSQSIPNAAGFNPLNKRK